jgi:hypothetical protein
VKTRNSEQKAVLENPSGIRIPLRVFRDRDVAVLESITEYLKDEIGMTYHEIAVLLNRDDRTIWTCYNRVKKKRKDEQE